MLRGQHAAYWAFILLLLLLPCRSLMLRHLAHSMLLVLTCSPASLHVLTCSPASLPHVVSFLCSHVFV